MRNSSSRSMRHCLPLNHGDRKFHSEFGGEMHHGSSCWQAIATGSRLLVGSNKTLGASAMTFTITAVNSSPLGFFDSGVGGLTVVRAVQELLPAENILYLGDTARLPYGSKSPETIRQFADEDVRFLISKGVKAIVVACNTATAHALPSLHEKYRIPILGVIEAGVEAALACSDAARIGIIATRGTIRSHAYQHALALRRTGLMIHGQATPLLVPLIEENWIDHPATRQVLKTYLDPLVEKGIDTLMLACTHYPLLIPILRELLPPDIRLVDSATTCAEHLKSELTRLDLLADESREGSLEIHLTDLSEEFEVLARRFLKKSPGRIRRAFLGCV
jgi:glutamate racemase